MAALARSVATLRVFGDDLEPEQISELLSCLPTWSARRGDITPSKSPNGTRTAETGDWRLQASETKPADINRQVSEILGQLTSDIEVWKTLTAKFDVDLFCGWFLERSNEGATLSADTLTALGQRGIELNVDVYGSGDDA